MLVLWRFDFSTVWIYISLFLWRQTMTSSHQHHTFFSFTLLLSHESWNCFHGIKSLGVFAFFIGRDREITFFECLVGWMDKATAGLQIAKSGKLWILILWNTNGEHLWFYYFFSINYSERRLLWVGCGPLMSDWKIENRFLYFIGFFECWVGKGDIMQMINFRGCV